MPNMSIGPDKKPASFKIVLGPDGASQLSELPPRTTIVIGREPDCDVVVKDAKSSRHHCRLTRDEDGFTLEDLGSRNGTFVEGQRLTSPCRLKVHQTFKIGDTIFYLA
jgi:pSer/pThr/pTyr-binding forkhead associated (FHA) protein